jgi:hypothetical protein
MTLRGADVAESTANNVSGVPRQILGVEARPRDRNKAKIMYVTPKILIDRKYMVYKSHIRELNKEWLSNNYTGHQ